jgi:hypothetical protein
VSKNEIGDTLAARLYCAEPADPERPTLADLHAMEHGGYHIPAEPHELELHGQVYRRGMTLREIAEAEEPVRVLTTADADAALNAAMADLGTYGSCATRVKPTGEIEHIPHHEIIARAVEALARADAHLPTDPKTRKAAPVYSGCMRYFPRALAAIAHLSKVGNDQHNPGEPLHWSRGKSDDHHDCIARHLLDAGTLDTDGERHSTKVAWRALAALELELEAAEAGQ